MSKQCAQVAVLMGSASDWGIVKETVDTLKKFGVTVEAKVISAHRTADLASEFSKNARSCGYKVIIPCRNPSKGELLLRIQPYLLLEYPSIQVL